MRTPTLPLLAAAAFALVAVTTLAAEPAAGRLDLGGFLSQVESQHLGLRAAREASEGAGLRSREGDLLLAPTLFGSAQYLEDARRSPFFPYRSLVSDTFTLGVSKQFSFGTQLKVSYGFAATEYQGLRPQYYEGRPSIELSQPLWRNWFGEETKASIEQIEAGALASKYSQSFQASVIRSDAETAYWRLALAREAVELQREALKRAERIQDWNERRVRNRLGDASDLYQAQAALQARQLQLEAAQDEARAAARAFNLARGIASDEVKETLERADPEALLRASAPAAKGVRADVRAAEQQSRAQEANARVGLERNSPDVSLYASYTRNSSLEPTAGDAFSRSLGGNYPTAVVGVRFTAPLDLGTISDDRQGYRKERLAADLAYQRKLFEQDQDWEDLHARFREAQSQLKLARALESIQARKSAHERDRLNHGRSTTYQVLVFEQDYAVAQLTRVQAQAAVLQVLSRFKLYSSEEGRSQ